MQTSKGYAEDNENMASPKPRLKLPGPTPLQNSSKRRMRLVSDLFEFWSYSHVHNNS